MKGTVSGGWGRVGVSRGPYPDVEVRDVPLTDFVLSRAEELGRKSAFVDGPSGRVLTYAGLADAAGRAAAGLAERGFGKGDVLAIHAPNMPEYAVAVHAAASLGGVVTTSNPLNTAGELARQLYDSGAGWLLTAPPFLAAAREAAGLAGVREIFVFGEAEGATPFSALLKGEGGPPEVEVDPAEDPVFLPYSSGTTGIPKGVMLTHRNVVANIAQVTAPGLDVFREDDTVLASPFFHISGLGPVMNANLRVGATVVTMPGFDLGAFLQTIQDHRVTVVWAVPPIVLALARHPIVEGYDLSSLRLVFSSAAPLGDTLARECAERLGCRVRNGYGTTETSPALCVTPADASLAKAGAIGPPIPNTGCEIVDVRSGAPLGPNEPGEVLVRGPQVMKGYLNRPGATAAAFAEDGWLRTGDLGYLDEDGYLYLVDRLKEMIKHGGTQVAPAELEAVLISHPEVDDAAVVGLPDEEAGEVPKAFVVTSGEADADELKAFVAGRVAPHKKIHEVEFVGEIPRTVTGKILRRALVEGERGGRQASPLRG
ncbi:AMP-binding protein [Rubrobacter tropicus]|uniref:AMP-binding protein n=1 Tax=Rubrobacter tropicus TaxID=2653851 RepID=A0A6G8QAZ9_9ACTN|nr:AMP-binding protein [Rubrobacter tropicus]QIN83608.1 AMP-binding protein [Rubrobacter tropicus]